MRSYVTFQCKKHSSRCRLLKRWQVWLRQNHLVVLNKMVGLQIADRGVVNQSTELLCRIRWTTGSDPIVKHFWDVAILMSHTLVGFLTNTTAYHLGIYETSSPSTKELHDQSVTTRWSLRHVIHCRGLQPVAPPPPVYPALLVSAHAQTSPATSLTLQRTKRLWKVVNNIKVAKIMKSSQSNEK